MTANAIVVIRNFLSSAHIKRKGIHRDGGDAAMNGGGGSNHAAEGRRGGPGRGGGDESDANSLLPRYLLPLVRHYHDDFYVSRSFDPRLIVQLMAEGFLPIATQGYLLPKLHVERCVLRLNPTSDLHVSKSTRKKARRFLLSVNECFDAVVAGCHGQHGTNWLYPPIVSAFRAIHQRTKDESAGGVNAMIMDHHSLEPREVTPVRLYSVEVWNAATGALAGGELGYSVGGIYSSLTGFSNEDAAGSVQLLALGQLLRQRGFECWDLGMTLDYKTRLGAALVSRTEFVGRVKRSRVEHKGLALTLAGRRNAKEFVDWDRPAAAPAPPSAAAAAKGATPKGAAAAKGATPKGNSRPEQNGAAEPSSGKVEASPKTKRKRPHNEGKGAS